MKVVDISTVVAGPFAAGLLGDHGAQVIKVEMPGAGDSLVVPRSSETPGKVHQAGPTIGEHNSEVYQALSLTPADIDALKVRRII